MSRAVPSFSQLMMGFVPSQSAEGQGRQEVEGLPRSRCVCSWVWAVASLAVSVTGMQTHTHAGRQGM